MNWQIALEKILIEYDYKIFEKDGYLFIDISKDGLIVMREAEVGNFIEDLCQKVIYLLSRRTLEEYLQKSIEYNANPS